MGVEGRLGFASFAVEKRGGFDAGEDGVGLRISQANPRVCMCIVDRSQVRHLA